MGPVWDKAQFKELLGLFICVCTALCTIVAHNTAQHRPDNFPSCPPDDHHCSDDVFLRERGVHLIHVSLDPPQSKSQTASRSVEPFSYSSPQSVPILYNERPFPPQNCHFPWGSAAPSNTRFLGSTRVLKFSTHLDRFSHFAGLSTVTDRHTDRPTDHATRSVTIGHIYVRSTAIQPNDYYTDSITVVAVNPCCEQV